MGVPHYADPTFGKLWAAQNQKLVAAWAAGARQVDLTNWQTRCCLGTQAQMDTPSFQYWMNEIKEPPGYARKQWEHFVILRTLADDSMLEVGRKGLGFGVGKEPLIGYFASRGINVLATDVALGEETKRAWLQTDQHIADVAEFNSRGFCDNTEFLKRVRYAEVDMNNIPASVHWESAKAVHTGTMHCDLKDFDFTWSANSLDHLGSLRRGLDFMLNSLKCLKVGGLAIHTTEFNVSSNTDTLYSGGTVFYRRRDVEEFHQEVRALGHEIAPLDLFEGDGKYDAPDQLPYHNEPHLKLLNGKFVVGSIVFIIRKLK